MISLYNDVHYSKIEFQSKVERLFVDEIRLKIKVATIIYDIFANIRIRLINTIGEQCD